MEWGESIQAIELLIALLYLLLWEYHRLVEFFFRTNSAFKPTRFSPFLKSIIRFSILLIPLFLIWNYDQGNDCVFEYNSQQRRLYGIYHLDKAKTKMTVIWHYPKNIRDTLVAAISTIGKDHKLLVSGKMGSNSMELELLKMNE
jgi:hypothetical protein